MICVSVGVMMTCGRTRWRVVFDCASDRISVYDDLRPSGFLCPQCVDYPLCASPAADALVGCRVRRVGRVGLVVLPG